MNFLDYYVYILFRKDTGQPFYVGYGRLERWNAHEKEARGRYTRNKYKVNIIRLMNFDVPKIKVAQGLSLVQAKTIEVLFISAIGRQPNGPLVNKTPGGDGSYDMSDETRRKISFAARNISKTTRIKMSESARNISAYEREQRRIRKLGTTLPETAKIKVGRFHKGKTWTKGMRWYHTPEGKMYLAFEPRNTNDSLGRGKFNPTWCLNISESKYDVSLDTREKMRKSATGWKWFITSEGVVYRAKEPRNPDDRCGRK